MEIPSVADVQIAIRALSFIETLPRAGDIRIAVVYAPAEREAAEAVAAQFAAASGPGMAGFRPRLITPDHLGAAASELDALFLFPQAIDEAATIRGVLAKGIMPSISNDQACLDQDICLMSVRAEPKVEIIMSTKFAAAAGIKLSTVFSMLVKRR